MERETTYETGRTTVKEQEGWKKWTIAGLTTKQVVWLAIITAIGGIAKGFWGQFRFFSEAIFGPMATALSGGFFIFWGMLAVFASRKFGAGTVTMTLGTFFELAAGNPYGMMVFVYNFFEGLGADVGFALFRLRFPKSNVLGTTVSALVGFVDNGFSFITMSLMLSLFVLPTAILGIYLTTSSIASLLYGIFAFGVFKVLERVGAVPSIAK